MHHQRRKGVSHGSSQMTSFEWEQKINANPAGSDNPVIRDQKKTKSLEITAQLDMFKPVQTGFDLRPTEQVHQEPTTITYIIEFTRLEQYCMDILASGEHDPIQIMRLYNQEHDSTLDWHEFSNALDHLHTRHFIEVASINRDGMWSYKIP